MPGLLPTELYNEVILWIRKLQTNEPYPRSISALRQCALVCTTFANLVRPHIFSVVNLNINDRPSSPSKLCDIFSSHPSDSRIEPAYRLVKTVDLWVDLDPFDECRTTIWRDIGVHFSSMANVLSTIRDRGSRFTSLVFGCPYVFDFVEIPTMDPGLKKIFTCFLQLCMSPTLKSLSIARAESVPARCLQNTSLRSLNLEAVHFAPNDDLISALEISSPCDNDLLQWHPLSIEILEFVSFGVDEDRPFVQDVFGLVACFRNLTTTTKADSEHGPLLPHLTTLTQKSWFCHDSSLHIMGEHAPDLASLRLELSQGGYESNPLAPDLRPLSNLRHLSVEHYSYQGEMGFAQNVEWMQRVIALSPPGLVTLALEFSLRSLLQVDPYPDSTTFVHGSWKDEAAQEWSHLVEETISHTAIQTIKVDIRVRHGSKLGPTAWDALYEDLRRLFMPLGRSKGLDISALNTMNENEQTITVECVRRQRF